MKVIFWLLTVMLVPVGLFAQSSPRESSDNQVKTPNALIENGAVTRVLIFHVPDSTMTRVALTPQALLAMAGSGFEITADIKERLRPVFAGVSFQMEKHAFLIFDGVFCSMTLTTTRSGRFSSINFAVRICE